MGEIIRQEELDLLFKDQPPPPGDSPPDMDARALPGGTVVLTIRGHIMSQTKSLHILDRVRELIKQRHPNLILDLSGCDYLSSILLGSIAKLASDGLGSGFRVLVSGANKTVRDIIRLTGLDREFLQLFETVDDAVKELE